MNKIAPIFDHPIVEALGWTLVHSIWQIALWAILALMFLTITHRKKAHIRYSILALVLLGICFSSVKTFTNHFNVGKHQAVYEQQYSVSEQLSSTDNVFVNESATNTANHETLQVQQQSIKSWFIDYFGKNLPAIITIWFLGFIFLFLKYVGGIAWMLRLRSISSPINEKIQNLIIQLSLKLNISKLVKGVSSNKITTPIVIGHLKPLILFPVSILTGLSEKELESIILHELAHIKRNDYLVNLIQSFLETIFFYHPALWWLSSAIRTEREHACDDLAIKSGANEYTMAKSLTEMAALAIAPKYAVAFAGKQHKLKQRIHRLIVNETMKTNTKQKALVACAIGITACMLSFTLIADQLSDPQNLVQEDNISVNERIKNEYLAYNISAESASQEVNETSPDITTINSETQEEVLLAMNSIEADAEVSGSVDMKEALKEVIITKSADPVESKQVASKKNRWGVKPTIVKKFTMKGSGNLEVRTSGGGIEVVGNNGNEVEVQAFVKINGRLLSSDDPRLDDLTEGYELIIEKNGNTVTASAKRIGYSSIWKRTSVSFIVFTPKNIACLLKTSGGGIQISDLSGNQTLKTSGGGIEISSVNGSVDANTSGGAIHVTDQDGNMNLHTSGGGIRIQNARGSVEGRTSGGGIQLQNIYGNAKVHTSGGGITINGHAEYVDASTSGGSIHADINGLSKSLRLSTSGGGIYTKIPRGLGMDLDLKGDRVNIQLENFTGAAKKNYIQGAMNGGGIPVYMHTSGGGVTVDFN